MGKYFSGMALKNLLKEVPIITHEDCQISLLDIGEMPICRGLFKNTFAGFIFPIYLRGK